jgi:hypothetical protein
MKGFGISSVKPSVLLTQCLVRMEPRQHLLELWLILLAFIHGWCVELRFCNIMCVNTILFCAAIKYS